MILEQHYKKTYSKTATKALCKIGGLHPADLDDFRKQLEDYAAIYRWENARHQDRQRSSDSKRELNAVRKRLTKLLQAIDDLSEDARVEFELGITRKRDADTTRSIMGKLAPDSPSLVLAIPGSDEALALGSDDLQNILGGLNEALDTGIERLPKRPPGQTRDYGLLLWMSNIRDLWDKSTNRPFTRDITADHEPITPAANFCIEAFKMIEPDYPNSRISQAMRECIARRKATCRIVAKNEQ
jgi:hypothetical protein